MSGTMTEPLDEKLSRVTFLKDAEAHISLKAGVCAACRIGRPCLTCCPAGNFKHEEKTGQVSVSAESCMECGVCRVVCTEEAVAWRWPRGGFGVCYLTG